MSLLIVTQNITNATTNPDTNFTRDVENFLTAVWSTKKKYHEKLVFTPELAVSNDRKEFSTWKKV